MDTQTALEYAYTEHTDGYTKGMAKERLRRDLRKILPVLKFNEIAEDIIQSYDEIDATASQAKELAERLHSELTGGEDNPD